MRYWVLIAAAAIVLSALLQPQIAAAAEEQRARVIEELVVTARRREEAAQTVPIPITAVTGADLEARVASDIKDLERVTPNLAFRNSGVAKNTSQVFLRGIGQTNWGPAQDPKVGVYLDGVYLARPQGGVFDLIDVERIEVLRGPQGTLFGRNTTAGAVHVITKKPAEEFGAQFHGGFGNDGQFTAAASADVPISDELSSRISFQHRESDGHVRNRFDREKWDDENAQNARVSLWWTPSEEFDALLNVDAQRVREHPVLGTCRFVGPEVGATAGGLDGLAFLGDFYDEVRDVCRGDSFYSGYEDDPNDESNIDALGAAMTLRWDINADLELTAITAVRDIEEVNGSWGLTGDSPAGNIIEVQQRNSRPSEYTQWSQEVRLSGSAFNDRLAYVGGIYAFTEDAYATFDVPLFRGWQAPDCVANPFQLPCFPLDPMNPAAGTLGGIVQLLQTFNSNYQVYDAQNDSVAVFAEGTYSFTDALSLTAGIRYTEDQRKLSLLQELLTGGPDAGYICPDGTPPVARKCTRDGDFSETTPRVILSYQVNNDVMVYGGWSKGYSSGGFNQNPRLQDYLPEVSKNWETGFKSTLLDGRLRLNATAFYNTYENQQLSVARIIDNQNVIAILNAQEATLYGVEVEILALLGDWTVTFAGGTTDGEYEEFIVEDTTIGPPPLLVETTELRDLSNNELVLGSPYTWSLSVAHNLDLGQNGKVVSQLGWSQRGRQENDLDTFSGVRLDSNGLLDGRVSYFLANGRTSVSLKGTNLLDKRHSVAAGGNDTSVRLGFYPGQPRRYALELRHELSQ